MNPLEYLLWLFVVILGLSVVGAIMYAFIDALQKRNIKTLLIFAVIVTAVLLLFAVYKNHLEKKKASSVVAKLEVQGKWYKLFSLLQLLVIPGFLIGLFLLLGILEEGFSTGLLVGLGLCICMVAAAFISEKKAKAIETDYTKSESELRSGVETLKSSMDLTEQSMALEFDYLVNNVIETPDEPNQILPNESGPEGSSKQSDADTSDFFSNRYPEVPDDEGDYEYTVMDGNEIKITRYIGSKQDPVIPQYINGHQVAVIGEGAFTLQDIVSVSIPEGVVTIENQAFAGCEELTKVLLPASLKNFGKGVFMGSEMLRDVSFRGENSDFTVKDGIIYDTKQRKLLLCPPALGLRKVNVEYGTVTIGDSAFYSNRELEIVKLPITLRTIEDSAFLFTNSLRIIELSPYIEEISDNAFLFGNPPFIEKHFEIYAFPNTYAYQYAEKNQIPVNPLYGIVTD